jgi:hypothetical protein
MVSLIQRERLKDPSEPVYRDNIEKDIVDIQPSQTPGDSTICPQKPTLWIL